VSSLPPDKKILEFELIDRILSGHHEDFCLLIAPYERRIFMTALDILQAEADAEEVSQEVFLKAFRSLRTFRRKSQFSTWLLRITGDESRMRLRKKREVSLDALPPCGSADPEASGYAPIQVADCRETPVEALLREETSRLVQESIAALPEKYREIVVLRDVSGLNIAEIAEILGLTVSNTKVRLLRARVMLRDVFVERVRGKTKSVLP